MKITSYVDQLVKLTRKSVRDFIKSNPISFIEPDLIESLNEQGFISMSKSLLNEPLEEITVRGYLGVDSTLQRQWGYGSMSKMSVVLLQQDSIIESTEGALEPLVEGLNNHFLLVDKATWAIHYQKVMDAQKTILSDLKDVCPDLLSQSNKDVAAYFLGKGMPVLARSSTGTPSMSREVLTQYAMLGLPEATLLIKAREIKHKLQQLKSFETYANEGWVQPTWNQFGQIHGRFSCENPNLQNCILEVRDVIRPRPGYKFVSVDWKMAEMASLTFLSKDPFLLEAYEAGRDVHQELGDSLTKNLTPEQSRRLGKTINYGLLYGMGIPTFSRTLQVPLEEAVLLVQKTLDLMPEVNTYRDGVLDEFHKQGQISTYFGRCLRDVGHDVTDRTAWHFHVAGSAADFTKIKMVQIQGDLLEAGFGDLVHLALNMHDEIIYEVATDVVEEVAHRVGEIFDRPVSGFGPMRSLVKTGSSWLEISK